MPMIRKLTTIGDSRGVTLPKSWIEYYEKESGCKITEVAMEVNAVIIIRPVLKKQKEGTLDGL
jgi:antitoxin component of MazEF toxin-antitoxin module